jgi:hypothetical protein
MSYPIERLCKDALNQIGFADYVFDSNPEQIASIAAQLNSMMANWNGQGIYLGYPIMSDPSMIDVNQDCNLPVFAIEPVYLSLCKRISPSFGKTCAPELNANIYQSFNSMLSHLAVIYNKPWPNTLPSGAGNRRSTWGGSGIGQVFLTNGVSQ